MPDQKAQEKEQPHSSPGTNSPSVTPKDLEPEDAASRDECERNTTSANPTEKEDALLDEGNELTFPASDPLPLTGGITRIEHPKK